MPPTTLIADDDPDIRELLRYVMERAGHRVVVVNNGIDALAAIRSLHLDLAVLDNQMPGLTGIEVIQACRDQAERPRLLIVSALDSPSDLCQGMAAGADGYLGKPFLTRTLLHEVEVLLSGEAIDHQAARRRRACAEREAHTNCR